MWIVRLALRRPYTFVVAALVLVLLTPFVLLRTPTDIFPNINIPVVSIIWMYSGLSAQEIEQRIVYNCERPLTEPCTQLDVRRARRCFPRLLWRRGPGRGGRFHSCIQCFLGLS